MAWPPCCCRLVAEVAATAMIIPLILRSLPPIPRAGRFAQPGAAIDNDVNDPNAAYKTNDSLADAQSIPNPVTLGGYVNQPGSGPDGRSRAAGDVTDYLSGQFAGRPADQLADRRR
ncbi:MAG: hypothetical protein MZU95_05610 [Desulfomicrobium escambiense]|nr:hypothetical protein [Desulfomicrobium escambiense]